MRGPVIAILLSAVSVASANDAPDVSKLTTEPVAEVESSGFGWRSDPIRHNQRFHGGTDFRADPGTPVLAAGDGAVIFAGRLGGYGNVVFIDHGGGVVTRYAHLRKIETHKDAQVSAGDCIGQVGSTGRTTGPHLHFEVRVDGRAVDPVTAMMVATVERISPPIGAAFSVRALASEVQEHAHDVQDPPARRDAVRPHHPNRPERSGREPRPQVLW
jgi:murein DD-endopeptidase MepM/ murein hydrolase activator NlpD